VNNKLKDLKKDDGKNNKGQQRKDAQYYPLCVGSSHLMAVKFRIIKKTAGCSLFYDTSLPFQ
jgi:hypothetical protein